MAVHEAEGTTEHPRIHRGAHTTDVSPYGDWDYLLPEYSRLTHEHLPNSELVIFRDSGHLPFWDAADRYHAAVLGFLKRHARALSREMIKLFASARCDRRAA